MDGQLIRGQLYLVGVIKKIYRKPGTIVLIPDISLRTCGKQLSPDRQLRREVGPCGEQWASGELRMGLHSVSPLEVEPTQLSIRIPSPQHLTWKHAGLIMASMVAR